jgi:hypothetical protein
MTKRLRKFSESIQHTENIQFFDMGNPAPIAKAVLKA